MLNNMQRFFDLHTWQLDLIPLRVPQIPGDLLDQAHTASGKLVHPSDIAAVRKEFQRVVWCGYS